MKVVMVIDHLGSGGAQRQFCALAKLLAADGHEVSVLTYYEEAFFLDELCSTSSILYTQIAWKNQWDRLWKVRAFFKASKPDVVVSFLDIPSMLSEWASLPIKRFRLVVSERDCEEDHASRRVRLKMLSHRLADAIVPNSKAQGDFVSNHFPKLRPKIRVISNIVDIMHFRNVSPRYRGPGHALSILVLARICPQKDAHTMLKAFGLLANRYTDVQLHWYGRRDASEDYLKQLDQLIVDYGIETKIQFHEPIQNVAHPMGEADLLCLPSVHEGCPNVVGEAMASALPVVASNVGDAAYLLGDEEAGFLYEKSSEQSLFEALEKFIKLDSDERKKIGQTGRSRAECLLSKDVFYDNWKKVIGI